MKHIYIYPTRRAAAAPHWLSGFLHPRWLVTSADASAPERCKDDLARMARAITEEEAAAGGGGSGGAQQ